VGVGYAGQNAVLPRLRQAQKSAYASTSASAGCSRKGGEGVRDEANAGAAFGWAASIPRSEPRCFQLFLWQFHRGSFAGADFQLQLRGKICDAIVTNLSSFRRGPGTAVMVRIERITDGFRRRGLPEVLRWPRGATREWSPPIACGRPLALVAAERFLTGKPITL
jgi:hypothetical protein